MPRANIEKLSAALEAEIALMKEKEREYNRFHEAWFHGGHEDDVRRELYKARNEVQRELCEINHRLYAIEVLLFVT